MSKAIGAIFFVTLLGCAIGYILVAEYLSFAMHMQTDYFYFAKNFFSLQELYPREFKISLIIIAAPALALLILGVHVFKVSLTTWGVTHWQTKLELRKNGFFTQVGDGFLLAKTSKPGRGGKFISSTKFPHCMVVAPTGRGKGVGFVIPNLLAFNGSVVCLDIKGENYRKTATHRYNQGDSVFRFAPVDFEGYSCSYNPLERISKIKDDGERMFELQTLASLFLVSTNDGIQGLLEGGKKVFVAACLLAFERGVPNLGEVYRIANGGENKRNQYAEYSEESKFTNAKLEWKTLASTNENTLTSYISLLNTSGLEPWKNPRIDLVTQKNDFSFDDLRKNPTSVYFCVPKDRLHALNGLVRLFFSELIATLQHHEPDPDKEPFKVMIFMDEFDALGKMNIVAESIKTLRSYGAHLAIITQTIPALDEIYGRNGRLSLEGGAGVKLYMTPSEEQTIENLSNACGNTTKRVTSTSRQSGISFSKTISERTEQVPLLSEDNARRLDETDVILVVDASHPIKAKAIVYYKDKWLQPLYEAQNKDANDNLNLMQKIKSERQEIEIVRNEVIQMKNEIGRSVKQVNSSSQSDGSTTVTIELVQDLIKQMKALSKRVDAAPKNKDSQLTESETNTLLAPKKRKRTDIANIIAMD